MKRWGRSSEESLVAVLVGALILACIIVGIAIVLFGHGHDPALMHGG